jgi:tetratricopeptide (TPR) repeat protein
LPRRGRAIEELLERKRGLRDILRAPELAWHFLQGDDPERALPWTLLAGDQAEVVFAHAEAEGQYRTALELARELEDAAAEAEALEKLGAVLSRVARFTEAEEMLEGARRLYRMEGNQEGETRAVGRPGCSRAFRSITSDDGTRRGRS